MTMKLKESASLKTGIRAREDKDFDQIIKIPDDNDRDSTQNFFNITDLHYNRATLTEISDIFSGDGKCSFEINFYVDMESATRSNIRSVRFNIYNMNPAAKTTTSIDSRVGSRQYFNERFLANMNFRSTSSGGSGHGKLISASKNNEIEKSKSPKELSKTTQENDGLLKTITVKTGVFDKTITDLRRVDRQNILSPRAMIGKTSVSEALSEVGQIYSALITPKINVNSDSTAINATNVNGQANVVDEKLRSNSGSKILESEQSLSIKTLVNFKSNPTSHLNSFYAAGPTASTSSGKERVQYGQSVGGVQNEVHVDKTGVESGNGFQSVSSKNRQNLTTQKDSSFSGKSHQQELYLKSASLTSAALSNPLIAKVPIKQITFKSYLKQFKSELDIDFIRLRPSSTREIYVKIELLDRDGDVFRERIIKVDLRRQLKTLMTPNLPPKMKICGQYEGKIELEIEQLDALATDVSIFRMIARPERLDESTWTKVTDIQMNPRRGAVRYSDTAVRGNVSPSIVLYEARCSGLFGSICTSTTNIVESGVKRITNLSKNRNFGECNIVAIQKGATVEVSVSNIPLGVTRIFVKRQLVRTATSETDYRNHEFINAAGKSSENQYHDVINSDGSFKFEDFNLSNRQIYRYYAQFDWLDRDRTNTISDDYLEFRILPDRPIISYMENMSSGRDSLGRSTVSFDLGASFSNEGLDELNRLLGETGVSSLFVEELKKDRSLISNLLVYEVARKHLKSGDTVVWPLVKEGLFTDDVASRSSARAGSDRASSLDLKSGSEYLYTARLLIINPERFFKEALTRIPASTKQIINDSDPNFIKVSAAKFAENFAIQPGTIQSPTTLEKDVDFRTSVQGAFTGISYASTIKVPELKAAPKNVRVHRNVAGRPANVIKWEVEGSLDSVYKFKVDVTLGRDNTFPLRDVSPIVSDNRSFEVRDELFVNEITPVSYRVCVIYNDFSYSTYINSNEIHAGSTMPVFVLDNALKRQIFITPKVDISSINAGTLQDRLAASSNQVPFLGGAQVSTKFTADPVLNQSIDLKASTISETKSTTLLNNNPIRRLREGR